MLFFTRPLFGKHTKSFANKNRILVIVNQSNVEKNSIHKLCILAFSLSLYYLSSFQFERTTVESYIRLRHSNGTVIETIDATDNSRVVLLMDEKSVEFTTTTILAEHTQYYFTFDYGKKRPFQCSF